MAEISTLKFNDGVSVNLKKLKYGSNWPVVYIINNNEASVNVYKQIINGLNESRL